MREMVDIAVLNNVLWCGIVCETHGIPAISRKHIWRTESKALTYYPGMITLSRHVTIDDVRGLISNKEVSSIKDSFALLDLSPWNFEMLFTAEWIHHDPVDHLESLPSGWSRVTTVNDLADWTTAHGTENIVRPELLERPEVKIYLKKKEGEVAGFIANLGADAVGISNAFSSVNRDHLWSAIHRIVAYEFPGLSMVGYERGAGLNAALKSGWTTIGPLRVWVRSKNGANG